MLRLTLLSAAAISAVHASVSTSVFPNSLCQGASNSLGGLVGVGKVTLANGEVEVHCGCPSDNLADFEACPSSAAGESVCNSVYDMSSGEFSASDCLDTIVNEVVVHGDECFNSERGSIGVATVDGAASCACSSEVDAADFTACAAPVNGKATCTTTDPDFLGASYDHAVQVACGVACNEGYTLTPAGTCTKVVKRDMGSFEAPVVAAASSSGTPHPWAHRSSSWGPAVPTTTTWHPHQAHTTSGASSATTTSYSYKYHHGHKSMGSSSSWAHSASNSWAAPTGTHVPWVSRHETPGGNNHNSQPTTTPGMNGGVSSSWMSYSTMPAPPSSSGVNHNAHPTTSNGAAPTTTSYSYNQHNGHSSKTGGGSASASASMVHWAHKRDAIPTGPAYVYKQHNARAPANHHRRSSSSGVAPSSSGYYNGGGSSMPPMMPTTTPGGSNHYAHTTPDSSASTSTSYSYKYHHHHQSSDSGSSSTGSSWSSPSASHGASSSSMMNWVPAPSMGPSGSNHNAHNPSSSAPNGGDSTTTTTTPAAATTTTAPWYGSTTSQHGSASATPGPSQRARRAADEFVFSDVCAQDERTCPGDDIMCVRLDDVTQCGGCHATGDAVNCLEIEGASSVSCLRGGCVVRSCQTGYFQTAEGRCERL
ncbi:hypothetical protein JCM3774_003911 [Rhodotorula dairenensis]